MQLAVIGTGLAIGTGFAVGMALFAGWLTVMLHDDRAHRVALASASRAHASSHRRAARSARYVPEPAPVMPVVRPGSFCRVPGNVAYSKHGTVLVCEATGGTRPRWRKSAARPTAPLTAPQRSAA